MWPGSPVEGNESYASDETRAYECTSELYIYFQCVWWAAGMLMGAPISLRPDMGPYEEHFSGPNHLTVLTVAEQAVVLLLKTMTAFEWVTVIARFVNVYNNLDPDTREFRMGWDALNRLVSYFKVSTEQAQELRRYYIERAEEAKARSRKRVMVEFSPYLREKFVWKLNKDWLIRVPCFSLVVERLVIRPESGMERFLVEVALSMEPMVFVPTERPPAKRLYIIVEGMVRHKGQTLSKGESYGAEDVLLKGTLANNRRAHAVTYLHVLWIGAPKMDMLGATHRTAYLLTKLWGIVYTCGTVIVNEYREEKAAENRIRIGNGFHQVPPQRIEEKITAGLLTLQQKKAADGSNLINAQGYKVFELKNAPVLMGDYEIIDVEDTTKKKHKSHNFQVVKRSTPSTPEDVGSLSAAAVEDLKFHGSGVTSDRARNGAPLPQIIPATSLSSQLQTNVDGDLNKPGPLTPVSRGFMGLLGPLRGGNETSSELQPLLETLLVGQQSIQNHMAHQAREQRAFMEDVREQLHQQKGSVSALGAELAVLRRWVTADVSNKLRA